MATCMATRAFPSFCKTILSRVCKRSIFTSANVNHGDYEWQDPKSEDEVSHGPLHGVRVLDMSRVLAGPYCTMILGDLGAHIIKVERPGTGDDTRHWGPPFVGDQSAYFLSVNRNKQSICVDLKQARGVEIIKDLCAKCDVLVENYIPGKLSELGVGYEDVCAVNPRLIYCSISGYGQCGLYRERAGYDVIAAAMGGLLHITGPRDGEPCKVGVAMTDLATGLYAHGAIMAALIHRHRTGRGQHIDCNLLASQVATLVNLGSNYLNAGQEATRWGTAHESIVPYQAFPTKDGSEYIVIGAGNDKQFATMCARLQLEHLVADPRFAHNPERVRHRDVLIEIISERLKSRSRSEWLSVLEGCGFPYGPINNLHGVFTDPHVTQSGQIVEMDHKSAGVVRMVGPAVRFMTEPSINSCRSAPPCLGEHTETVLTQVLEYDRDIVERLRRDGVIAGGE